MNCLRNDQQGR